MDSGRGHQFFVARLGCNDRRRRPDRKSTRLNSSHRCISYAVFCFPPTHYLPSFPTRRSSDLYQNGVMSGLWRRGAPDVAFDADPASGVPVYDSYNGGVRTPWIQVGGTSFSSPAWAAMIAVADQIGRAHV